MKKKCKGYRALQKKLLGIGYYCGLNHPIKAIAEIDGIPVEYKSDSTDSIKSRCRQPGVWSFVTLPFYVYRHGYHNVNQTL